MVEEALRLNVKWSMQEINRAINGDGKTTPNPLFKVMVILNSKVKNCLHVSNREQSTNHSIYTILHMYMYIYVYCHILYTYLLFHYFNCVYCRLSSVHLLMILLAISLHLWDS